MNCKSIEDFVCEFEKSARKIYNASGEEYRDLIYDALMNYCDNVLEILTASGIEMTGEITPKNDKNILGDILF